MHDRNRMATAAPSLLVLLLLSLTGCPEAAVPYPADPDTIPRSEH